ncbi:MAG: hypothetical protein LBT55_07425 [Clostridiaceae bacterium]|jgi:hypothetical protein|nr:hypothetical protein [Clostridiaceae bacterium]
MNQKVLKTLLKKATGYRADEVQEEYSVREDGGLELVKKKVIKKYYPPDNAALKSFLEFEAVGDNLSDLSDEELQSEKGRLLKILNAGEVAKDNDGAEGGENADGESAD